MVWLEAPELAVTVTVKLPSPLDPPPEAQDTGNIDAIRSSNAMLHILPTLSCRMESSLMLTVRSSQINILVICQPQEQEPFLKAPQVPFQPPAFAASSGELNTYGSHGSGRGWRISGQGILRSREIGPPRDTSAPPSEE